MTKDAEKVLKFITDRAKETGSSDVYFIAREIQNIPNIDFVYSKLIDELKRMNMISNCMMFCGDQVRVWLTTDGLEYFDTTNKITRSEGTYMNVFTGNASNIQIQQGNVCSTQNQTLGDGIEYDKIKQVIEEIKKYENQFEDAYKDNTDRVREIVTEITELVEHKKEPQKIKQALLLLKELSIGATGSLVASGICGLLTTLGL